MAGEIVINAERCKGCGLCVAVCTRRNIEIGRKSNKKGYFPAVSGKNDCSGCALCAIICPDAAIIVLREKAVEEKKAGRKKPSKGVLPK